MARVLGYGGMGNTNGARIFAGKAAAVVPEPAADSPTGGYTRDQWWFAYDQEMERRRAERRRLARRKKKAKKIADQLDRELALAERAIEEEEARKAELARLNRIVAQNMATIAEFGPRLTAIAEDALERQTFSTMERLERELRKQAEEERWFLAAVEMLVNQ